MKVLVTGAAGFIGMYLSRELAKRGYDVIGLDNINTYYDPTLKYARLKILGIEEKAVKMHSTTSSSVYPNFSFIKEDICNSKEVDDLFSTHRFKQVFHLAAQAGVQYSLKDPDSYIHSNINGFYHILDACRRFDTEHLLFASSSSVYGMNDTYPYSTSDKTDRPASLYAATKKANELIAYSYAHTHHVRSTALRFFTVYGPWGRPDMAPYIFTEAIKHRRPIKLNNKGEMWRDFTFIDDIVQGILLITEKEKNGNDELFQVFNIGNSHPSSVNDLVEIIESITGNHPTHILTGLPDGDVLRTYADISPMVNKFGYHPEVSLEEGMKRFIEWYDEYHKVTP